MKRTRRVAVILVLSALGGIGAVLIWSSLCGQGGSKAESASKSAEGISEGQRDSTRSIPKRIAEALRKPDVAIKDLEAKYRGVALGRLEPKTPEYERFTGDCYLLSILDSEESDDLLATWFVRADEDEEALEDEWKGRGIYPSLQALTSIRRPRSTVIDRMLARAGYSKDGLKLYSWASHLARWFHGDRTLVERLDEQIGAWEGRAAGRYRHLRNAVIDGPHGPLGPPDSSGVKK